MERGGASGSWAVFPTRLRGCLFIERRAPTIHPLFFTGARLLHTNGVRRGRAPLKNKGYGRVVLACYKQATTDVVVKAPLPSYYFSNAAVAAASSFNLSGGV
jgi:hypothetical protein